MAEMKSSSKAEQLEVMPDAEMAFKEYEILEKAADRGTTLAYTVTGIFVGGLFTASAILIPEIAEQDCGVQLVGYFLASVAILSCTWFWFLGINMMWRARTVIMFHRLQELEGQLGFEAHRRIHLFYESQKKGHKWPGDQEPKWYGKLRATLGWLTPWGPNTNTWWFVIISNITLAHIITWLFVLCRCLWSWLQCLSRSIL